MTHDSIITRSRYGLMAQTEAVLIDNPRGQLVLILSTIKYDDLITSHAVVRRRDRNYNRPGWEYTLFSAGYQPDHYYCRDFLRHAIATAPCKRATEQAIRAVHTTALQQLDTLLAEARAFYAAKAKPLKDSADTLTHGNPLSWLSTIWDALHCHRENSIPEGVPEYDRQWSDICTAMAWIHEKLDLPIECDYPMPI